MTRHQRPRHVAPPTISEHVLSGSRTALETIDMPKSQTPDAPRVLIADDQPDVLVALRMLLRDEGYDLTTANSPEEILRALDEDSFDAVLMDMNYTRDTTTGKEGLTLLQVIRAQDDTLPVLVMTGWSSVEGAVAAMQHGANDYIEKPWNDERLLHTLHTQIELSQALRRARRAEAANQRLQKSGLPVMIGDSAAMKEVLTVLERIAPSDANVLITGEHGTGKEVVAQWLHAASNRADKPLVTVNAGGLSEGVAESEFFGHVKGAFTDARTDRIGCFELADGGTLFLDEIANTSTKLQAKLLRVLQTGDVQRVGSSRTIHVDVRVIAALGAQRVPYFPEVATATEQGYDVQLGVEYFWFMPDGTPADRVETFGAALAAALADEQVNTVLERQGMIPTFATGADSIGKVEKLYSILEEVAATLE